MPLKLVLLALHRLTSHFYKLGRHVSGDALRVISMDGQPPTHEKGVDGYAHAGFTIRGPTPPTSYRIRVRVASWGVSLVQLNFCPVDAWGL